jgi:DNA-binding transcriptional regulator YiaG
MKTTNHTGRALPAVLISLKKSGFKYERIAHELGVSWGTVKSWETKRRKPKLSTVQRLEHLYGVKVAGYE